MLIIDALQYSNWSRALFEEMRHGGLDCAHVTIAYHETCAETLRSIGAWNRLLELHGDLIMRVRDVADLNAARAAGKTGIVFGFQNCSPIEDDCQLVEIFHALGVRFMQLSYNNQSPLATGCYEDRDSGITRFGKQVIDEMNRVGMVIDMSHSAELSTLEAIDYSSRPIAITHANPSWFADVPRNKSNAVLKALADSGGMLGLSLYPFHLKDGSNCTREAFCAMAARTAELMGVERLGIGSDLCRGQPASVLSWMRDGRWRKPAEGGAADPAWPQQPAWFSTSADYGNLAEGLERAGFSGAEVERIMGRNWLDFFARSFGPAQRPSRNRRE
ncbi:MAG: membrane dipeptidase [Gammaproteobacteria bacterium]|nr:membrane dipeptidase [Gammaproteobacteria bacterium]MDD9875062.1 membrane dipeptidase [Gammaproteobacteria bacterium]